METIYINCDKGKIAYEQLSECSENISSDVKKINELIDDLKRFWVGTEANNFCNVLDEYITSFQEISKAYSEDSDNLKRCIESYKMIDEKYSSESM